MLITGLFRPGLLACCSSRRLIKVKTKAIKTKREAMTICQVSINSCSATQTIKPQVAIKNRTPIIRNLCHRFMTLFYHMLPDVGVHDDACRYTDIN